MTIFNVVWQKGHWCGRGIPQQLLPLPVTAGQGSKRTTHLTAGLRLMRWRSMRCAALSGTSASTEPCPSEGSASYPISCCITSWSLDSARERKDVCLLA